MPPGSCLKICRRARREGPFKEAMAAGFGAFFGTPRRTECRWGRRARLAPWHPGEPGVRKCISNRRGGRFCGGEAQTRHDKALVVMSMDLHQSHQTHADEFTAWDLQAWRRILGLGRHSWVTRFLCASCFSCPTSAYKRLVRCQIRALSLEVLETTPMGSFPLISLCRLAIG